MEEKEVLNLSTWRGLPLYFQAEEKDNYTQIDFAFDGEIEVGQLLGVQHDKICTYKVEEITEKRLCRGEWTLRDTPTFFSVKCTLVP